MVGLSDGISLVDGPLLGEDDTDGSEEGSNDGWLLGCELIDGMSLMVGSELGRALTGDLLVVGIDDTEGVPEGGALGVLVGAAVTSSPPANP
mmetsp:Transcript_25684/g.55262  ORF Transcript_25684/g.55262 Transcript_25684/m.55262 type:complete len:92 (-) Transcript_25684:2553-2828(-)